MSNSSLVNYTKISPHKNSPRNHAIDKITIHHMAGNLSVETCGEVFQSRQASSNYGIGSDGRVGMYVEEKDRTWASSSPSNDHRAVTIEVANCAGEPDWKVSDVALAKLIELCADICQRNGIKELVYTGDSTGNLTRHNMFAATRCVPIDSELLTPFGWKKLSEIQIGDTIATALLDGMDIVFDEVLDKVPVKKQDVYTNNGLYATKDHRMVYCGQYNKEYRIDFYNNLLNNSTQIYIPLAGQYNGKGLDVTNEMLKFLIAVQADGHYMYDTLKDGSKSYYGLEFHFKRSRKIERIKSILENLHFEYSENGKKDGSVSIRIYNQEDFNIKNFCEEFLQNKCFTWEWLNLSKEQSELFLSEILLWDGCCSGNKYTSTKQINLEVVNAIASINNKGSRIIGKDVLFRETPYITLSKEDKGTRRLAQKEVSCVTVKSGLFLIRQYGKTFIVGNCPGEYLQSKFPYIASQVNSRLQGSTPTPTPEPSEHLYRVQTGAFENKENALNLEKELESKGYDTYVVQVGNLYKVQVGAFSIKENADNMANKLKADGYETYITDNESAPPVPVPQKSNEEIAKEVIQGKWGVGVDRANRLAEAGYDYDEIQAIVNQLLS